MDKTNDSGRVRVRLATLEDAGAIARIYNQAVEARFQTAALEPVTEADRRRWLEDHHPPQTHPVWVAQVGQEVAGWCSLSAYRPGRQALQHSAEISYYVHQDHRRKGIASTLMQHAIDVCPELGLKVLFAVLLDVNTASVALLERHGFEKWGHLPGVALIDGVTCGHLIYGRNAP